MSDRNGGTNSHGFRFAGRPLRVETAGRIFPCLRGNIGSRNSLRELVNKKSLVALGIRWAATLEIC